MTEETQAGRLPLEAQFDSVCEAAAHLLDVAALADAVADGGVPGILAIAVHALWVETYKREGADGMDAPKGLAHGLASVLSTLEPPVKLHQARELLGEISAHAVAGLRDIQLAQTASGPKQ